VDIKIYDTLGRRVNAPLKNGIYFIKSGMDKKKMWVIK